MSSNTVITRVQDLCDRFAEDENGATFIEYTLMVGLLSLALLTFFGNTATSMNNAFQGVSDRIDNP